MGLSQNSFISQNAIETFVCNHPSYIGISKMAAKGYPCRVKTPWKSYHFNFVITISRGSSSSGTESLAGTGDDPVTGPASYWKLTFSSCTLLYPVAGPRPDVSNQGGPALLALYDALDVLVFSRTHRIEDLALATCDAYLGRCIACMSQQHFTEYCSNYLQCRSHQLPLP